MKSRWMRSASMVAGVLVLAGCMPTIRRMTAFSSRFADNDRTMVERVYRALPSAIGPATPAASATPILVGVRSGEQRTVAAYDLAANRQLWSSALNATSAPELLGDLVLVSAGERLLGLDARTGQQRWTMRTNAMAFAGAARDGDTVVVVLSLGAQGGAARVGRVVAVDARGGGERWSHEVVGILGRPAISSGYAFVPWDRQSLSVLELATGIERARVRATDDVLSWVLAAPQGVFYGSRGAYRWTPRSASGTRADNSFLGNPLENVPGDPMLFRDAFIPSTGARTARDKIRFTFLPRGAEGDQVAFEHNTIYLSYYRFIIAVDAQTGEVHWARALGTEENEAPPATTGSENAAENARRLQARFHQHDIEAVALTADALVCVSSDGTVRTLDPRNGAILGAQRLDHEIGAMAIDPSGFRPNGQGALPAPEGTPREQLLSLIRDADNRLVPIRSYLVRLLARRPEQEVTRDLLELYRSRTLPGALRTEIATALRARRNGAQFLVAALDGERTHFNFLENRQAPPLDVIAPTLASMGAREAVPVLMQHLLDHETPREHLSAVISAIAELGDATSIPQLQAFVQRYRADSAFAGDRSEPLNSATSAIFRLGDQAVRPWLTALSEDTRVHEPVRTAIRALFENERAGGERQTQEQRLTAAQEELQGNINQLRAVIDAFPVTMTNENFDLEWNNHLDELRACAQSVLARRPELNELRITVTLRSEPAPSLFQSAPPAVRLPENASFEQRLAAVAEQQRWVQQQQERLEAHRSIVRSTAYAPQDAEMARCMDGVLRPLRFAGFGRSVSVQQFLRRISTVRQAQRDTMTSGFGVPRGGTVMVPWFLVSSPSLDVTAMRLIPPPAPSTPSRPTPGTPPTPPSTSGADAGVASTPNNPPTPNRPPTQPGQDAGAPASGTTRPWWEEQ